MIASHDAFISYSHDADTRLARAVESAMEKLAKPFLKIRAIDVFRDETTLSADPRLWSTIVAHLERAKWLVFMASPEAATSPWCIKEVSWWLEHRSPERLLILLTGGTIAWDLETRDFDWTNTSALPPVLRGRLLEPPLYVDLRWTSDVDDLSLQNPRFREAAVSITAPVRGMSRDDLYSEDARLFKRGRRLVRGLQLSIAVAAVVAIAAAAIAWQQRNDARVQRDAALRTQSLFLADLSVQRRLAGEPEIAALLAREALPRQLHDPDRPFMAEAESALYEAVTAPIRAVVFREARARIQDARLIHGGVRVLTLSDDGVLRTIDITTSSGGKELVIGPASFAGAAFYQDGTRIVTLSKDVEEAFSGRIHDLAGAVELVVPHLLERYTNNARVWSVAGSRLVFASGDSYGNLSGTETRAIWNPAHKSVRRLSWTVSLSEEEPKWNWIANADGTQVAVVEGRKVILIDTTRGDVDFNHLAAARATELNGHQQEVLSAQYSPDGRLVVTGSVDHTARIWDSKSGAELHALNGHKDAVLSAAFSSDGRRVATGSADGTARLWDAKTGLPIRTMKGQGGAIDAVRFSDGDRYVVISSKTETRSWSTQNGMAATGAPGTDRQLEIDEGTVAVAVSSGAWVASLYGHDRPITSVSFSQKAGLIATSSVDGMVRLWDIEQGTAVRTLRGHEGEVQQAMFDPSGTHLVTAGDTTARVWQAETGREVAVLRHPAGEIVGARFSPDGRLLVTVSSSGTAHVWDLPTSTEASVLRGHQKLVHQARFVRGGREIITWSADGTARRWDAQAGTEIRRFEGHTSDVISAALSADETLLVTGSTDGTARLWSVATGSQSALFGPHSGAVRQVAFDPGSKMVLTASAAAARLWDVASGVVRHELPTESEITHAEFSPDGRRVTTASADGVIRAWSAETGRLIAVVRRYPERATHAVLSPDASRMVTASEEGTAHLLRFFPTTQALIDYSRTLFNRALTQEERQRFFLEAR